MRLACIPPALLSYLSPFLLSVSHKNWLTPKISSHLDPTLISLSCSVFSRQLAAEPYCLALSLTNFPGLQKPPGSFTQMSHLASTHPKQNVPPAPLPHTCTCPLPLASDCPLLHLFPISGTTPSSLLPETKLDFTPILNIATLLFFHCPCTDYALGTLLLEPLNHFP